MFGTYTSINVTDYPMLGRNSRASSHLLIRNHFHFRGLQLVITPNFVIISGMYHCF